MSGSAVTTAQALRASRSSNTGFFGKLPSRGDFISRYLPRSFLDPLDHWLQTAIQESRRQLGNAWRDYYCTGPMWRFVLSEGLCGHEGYAGLLMPSVDRVNRYYPLVIAAPLPAGSLMLPVLTVGEHWFKQVEQLALHALECDDLDLDLFSQAVNHLGIPPVIARSPGCKAMDQPWYCPLPEGVNPLQTDALLADSLLRRGFARPSLWWTEGSDHISRCMLVCEGLPPPKGFAALLAGGWQKYGWMSQSFVGAVDCGDLLTTAHKEEEAY